MMNIQGIRRLQRDLNAINKDSLTSSVLITGASFNIRYLNLTTLGDLREIVPDFAKSINEHMTEKQHRILLAQSLHEAQETYIRRCVDRMASLDPDADIAMYRSRLAHRVASL